MVVRTYDSKDAIGAAAATLFAACVIGKPHAVLGLATGSTPIPTYQKMAELYRMGAVDFSGVITFNLDEYVGLNHEHEQSYYYFMILMFLIPKFMFCRAQRKIRLQSAVLMKKIFVPPVESICRF